jgi:hypothetical protein
MRAGAGSISLVVAQLACLASLALTGPVLARGFPWIIPEPGGVLYASYKASTWCLLPFVY